MTSFTVDKCNQCGTENKRDASMGWRELRYMSRIAREDMDTESKHFCSWACLANYANTERGRA